jgi:hypothetical protein
MAHVHMINSAHCYGSCSRRCWSSSLIATTSTMTTPSRRRFAHPHTHSHTHGACMHGATNTHMHDQASQHLTRIHVCMYLSPSLSLSLSCCVGLQRTLRAQWSRMLTALRWSSSASALPPWATALVRTTGTVPTVGCAGLFWSVAVPGGRGGTVCVWVSAFAPLCAHACLPASVPVCSVVTDDTWACMCLRPGQSGRVSGL